MPAEGKDPFYCLLEDDRLVSHLEVETDTLLDTPTGDNGGKPLKNTEPVRTERYERGISGCIISRFRDGRPRTW